MKLLRLLVFILSKGRLVKDSKKVSISKNAKWFDDYFTVEHLDENTVAIAEPRYWQRNYSYLIIGAKKAILFDTGSGTRDIEPVVRSLTSLPVIAMASHFHYDHIGSINNFESTVLCKNQLKNQKLDSDDTFVPTKSSFLGGVEGYTAPKIKVDKVIDGNESIKLGGRDIQILPIPGHAENSIALYDRHSKMLFIGDFMVPGLVSTNRILIKDASLEDTLRSSKLLMDKISEKTRVLCAHSMDGSLPELAYSDILDVHNFIKTHKLKEGLIPKYKRINDRMSIFY